MTTEIRIAGKFACAEDIKTKVSMLVVWVILIQMEIWIRASV